MGSVGGLLLVVRFSSGSLRMRHWFVGDKLMGLAWPLVGVSRFAVVEI